MTKTLSDWLQRIGQEIFDKEICPDGTVTKRTNDEQLARMIWKRALGHEIKTEHENGEISFTLMKPDAKAQSFIFERREGKFVAPVDDKSLTPLDRINDMIKDEMNDAAKAAVDDDRDTDNSDTDDDATGTVSDKSRCMDRPDYEPNGSEEFSS